MHFNDMPYRRVTFEEIEARYQALFERIRTLRGREDCLPAMEAYYRLLDDMTPMDLCYVRHDMDLNEAFYAGEQRYYDEIGPRIGDLSNQLEGLLLNSPYSACFEELMGSFAFDLMRCSRESRDSRLIPLEQQENTLSGRYSVVTANAKAEYEGAVVSRSSLAAKQQSPDRETRRRASAAVAASWAEQREELEELFHELVQNRDKQAKLLGYPNYVKLAYLRMDRIGYTSEDVSRFREQVKESLVPVAAAIHEQRKKRLGLEHLYSFDSPLNFPNGNPVPLGDTEFCLESTREMFRKLSPETGEFIDFLMDNGLYDVKPRDGKRSGGYCMYLSAYRAPFIFANFDGTHENAYIMSHEGGHAFYAYLKREEKIRGRCGYTSEMAETHAMAMEFFVAPYMELFFGSRAEDYRRMHLESAVSRIIYQCQQDEFQQIIYEHPELSIEERNGVWEKLEQSYFPFREYTEEEKQRIGRRWQCIPHLYHWPFYAIDYGLAQVCALEYARWMDEDKDGAWQSYLRFCRASGNMNFPEALKAAGLESPFEEGCLTHLVDWLQKRL